MQKKEKKAKSWIKWGGLLAVILVIGLVIGIAGRQNQTLPLGELTEDFRGTQLKLGSKVPDFEFVDAQGNTQRLYKILQEKKLVVLNFWFINCPYCVEEFPLMERTYAQYKDSVQILALNPYDSNVQIQGFQGIYGLSFPMGEDVCHLSSGFGVGGFPTSVFVDRYGVACLIVPGAIRSESQLQRAFAYFAAEDYETVLLTSLNAISEKK